MDKGVLVVERPNWFQVPNLNQEILFKNHYFVIKKS
jgi:hypothetical protein